VRLTTATAAPRRNEIAPASRGTTPPPARLVTVELPWAEYVATWPLARAWGIHDLEELIREALRRAARGVGADDTI
jgi:hypothetical protein